MLFRSNYSTYDVEFYAIVQAIKHWEYYLAYKEFILHTDHEALKHLNNQATLNKQHAQWAVYLQQFYFSLRHKVRVLNRVADGLSRRSSLQLRALRHLGSSKGRFQIVSDYVEFATRQQSCLSWIQPARWLFVQRPAPLYSKMFSQAQDSA